MKQDISSTRYLQLGTNKFLFIILFHHLQVINLLSNSSLLVYLGIHAIVTILIHNIIH